MIFFPSMVLLERWEDRISGHISYIFYAMSLIQSSGAGQECLNFNYQKEQGDDPNLIKFVLLSYHCWYIV